MKTTTLAAYMYALLCFATQQNADNVEKGDLRKAKYQGGAKTMQISVMPKDVRRTNVTPENRRDKVSQASKMILEKVLAKGQPPFVLKGLRQMNVALENRRLNGSEALAKEKVKDPRHIKWG